jgi:flagellar L-ring protein FlgH
MKAIIYFLPISIAFLFSSAVRADSLFPGSSTYKGPSGVSLFSDNKAHRVGDTLIVNINEAASATSTADTKNSKNDSMSYGPGIGPLLVNLKALGLGGTISSAATGTTDRTDNLVAHISVTVKSILPNGNFVVEGKRQVGMNDEMQEITLTGVVRPQDIGSDNSVASPLVADAQIKFGGKGPVGDKQHEGLITKMFKFLF